MIATFSSLGLIALSMTELNGIIEVRNNAMIPTASLLRTVSGPSVYSIAFRHPYVNVGRP